MAPGTPGSASRTAEGTGEARLVLFTLGSEAYALEVEVVREILATPSIARVPRVVSFVAGVVDLRGEVVPVVDVRTWLEVPGGEAPARHTLVAEVRDTRVGLRVDAVTEILAVPRARIQPLPATLGPGPARLVKGIVTLNGGRRLLVVLDLERAWDEQELAALRAVAEEGSS